MKRFIALLFGLTLLASTSFAGLTIVTPAMSSMGTNVDTLRATYADYWSRTEVASATTWALRFDSANRLQAMSGYTDSFGKAYHYLVGCASNSAAIFSVPVNCVGYKSASVIVFGSTHTAEPKTAATQVLCPTTAYANLTVSLWGTPYPYDFVQTALTNTALAYDSRLMGSGVVQLPLDKSWDVIHASSSAIIAGASATGLETVTTTGATNSVATVTAGNIKTFNIEGLSILYVGMVMSTAEYDGEAIIRLYK
jgi:hypothetical protein